MGSSSGSDSSSSSSVSAQDIDRADEQQGYTEAQANAAGVDTSQDTSFSDATEAEIDAPDEIQDYTVSSVGGFDYEGAAYGTTPSSSYGGTPSSDDYDASYNAADASFPPTQEDPSVGDQITDFITGGGLIGAGIRGLQDVLGTQPNQYAGIEGEDGYGGGDYVSTLDDFTESRGLGTSYSDLDLENQAFIDKEAFDAGYRSESFNDLYNTGDTSNLQNLNQTESDFVRQLIPQAPFLVGGGTAPKSMVNEYFSNLQTQQNSGGILDRYNEAKSNISGILGTNNQLGVSNSTNFYYDYLTKQGLL